MSIKWATDRQSFNGAPSVHGCLSTLLQQGDQLVSAHHLCAGARILCRDFHCICPSPTPSSLLSPHECIAILIHIPR